MTPTSHAPQRAASGEYECRCLFFVFLEHLSVVAWILDMRSTFGASLSLMEQSAGLMGRFLPGHEWEETRNKLQAFRLFAFADQELEIPPRLR